jgi:hypothetical protein
LKKTTLLFVLFIIYSISAYTQTDSLTKENYDLMIKDPVGREFWLCFMMNYKEDPDNPKNALLLELFITGDKDANVTINIEAIGYHQTIFVPGGTVKSIVIDSKAQIKSFDIVERGLAVEVTSDTPISVYGLNRRYQTTDTYLGFPVNVLGTEYRVMCYHAADIMAPIFAIVGIENNTIVNITPNTLTSSGRKKGEIYQVTLNKGDVYQVRSETLKTILRKNQIDDFHVDLTGSLIKSNKKIAVFSGHECSYVPAGPPRIKACNHLVEQMPPINSWGKHFYIGKFKGRSFYTFRVLANENNTKIFENSKQIATLQAGEFIERNSKENLQITADKPVLVAQYSQGFENGDAIGDPMMLLISPTQQFLNQYRFATPVNGSWNHYINVVVPNSAINTIELDGQKVDSKRFETLGLTRYSIAFLQVPYGTHYIRGEEPFGMYSYGFGFGDIDAYDAYGNMGGQSFLEFTPKKDKEPPMADLLIKDNKPILILRDDRIDDSGLKSFSILDSNGIIIKYPNLVLSAPQLAIEINPDDYENSGMIVFQVTDAANNSAIYTLCFGQDNNQSSSFGFSLTSGTNKACLPDPGFQIGAFGKYLLSYHNSDFSSAGNVNAPGHFSSSTGSGGYFGLYAGRKISRSITLNAKLSLEKPGGTISAPDSLISQRRDPVSLKLMPFQESHEIVLKSLLVTLSAGADYNIMKYFYITGGVNLSLMLNDNIDLIRKIIIPDNYIYSNGSYSMNLGVSSLGDFNSFRFGFYGGIGSSVPINRDFTIFIEGTYNYYPFNIINSGTWKIDNISMILGVKYRL